MRLEPNPWWPGVRRRWRDRRTWQLAGVAAVTALTAVTVTAAATPAAPATLSHQFTVAGTSIIYDEQALYVVDQSDRAATGQATITAYRLADGTVRWQGPLPGRGGSWLTVWDGALLATSEQGGGIDQPAQQTTRLDPGTGEPLWTAVGWPGQAAGGWLVLQRDLPMPLSAEPVGDEVPRVELTIVDFATGAPAWRTEIVGWTYDLDADGASLVTMDEDSELRSHHLATGELMATRSLPTPDDPDQEPYYGNLDVIGSTVFLLDQPDPAPAIATFDAVTLAPRWQVPEPVDGPAPPSWPNPCAGLVCLTGPEHPPRALDPATGEPRWTADWLPPEDSETIWYDITDLGAIFPDHLADHLVLAQDRESGDDRTSWLVEASTGTPVLDLGRWRFLSPYWEAPATTTAPLLSWQDDHTIWIGRLRSDLSGVVVVGTIEFDPPDDSEAIPPYCDAQGDHLVCIYDGDDPVRAEVWRLRA